MTSRPPSLVCFHQDLRLRDQPALRAAARRGAVIPVFILEAEEQGAWAPGAASRWWLHQSLASLDEGLRERGSRLVLRKGETLDQIRSLAEETGAGAVFWNRGYEPAVSSRQRILRTQLTEDGLIVEEHDCALLYPPERMRSKQGGPYKVFTPFWRALRALREPAVPLLAPRALPAPVRWPQSLALDDLALEPEVDWAGGLREAWQPGEQGARARLQAFLRRAAADYAFERDRPDHEGVSRLSPHLHFGEIGPRQVWGALRRWQMKVPDAAGRSGEAYLRQLAWREFAHHLLHHFPFTPDEALNAHWDRFPWRKQAKLLSAWQKGQTGIPLVDAGMRELWATGWMHNRVRMVAGSYLVKQLLQPWQEGARWFWSTLVDADLANNSLGWQWVAGCGADAAPYFRVFNPVLQGKRFDPEGNYVRSWVPELKELPAALIHEPWSAPAITLSEAGIRLGKDYPRPIVDPAAGRSAALAAYESFKDRRERWAEESDRD